MKLIYGFLLPIVCAGLLITSCEKEGGSSTEIGGDTNLDENKIGYTAQGSFYLNNSSIAKADLEVVGSNNGLITVACSASIPSGYSDKLDKMGPVILGTNYSALKSNYIDSQGNFECELKIKNTSEGVAYVNSSGEQCVIMKYGANVGDTWNYTKKNGKVTNFKVTSKSTVEDYDYIFWKIKVVKVEQTFNEPGFSKIIYIGNHKYGLVAVEIRLDDGTVLNATKI